MLSLIFFFKLYCNTTHVIFPSAAKKKKKKKKIQIPKIKKMFEVSGIVIDAPRIIGRKVIIILGRSISHDQWEKLGSQQT